MKHVRKAETYSEYTVKDCALAGAKKAKQRCDKDVTAVTLHIYRHSSFFPLILQWQLWANLKPWVIHYKCWTEIKCKKKKILIMSSFHTDKGTFLQYMTDRIINHLSLSKFISFLFAIMQATSQDPCFPAEVVIPVRFKPSNLAFS